MSFGEGDLHGRVKELEELLDSAHQTIHAMQGKLVELERENTRLRGVLEEIAHTARTKKVV